MYSVKCGSWLACEGGLSVGAFPGLTIPFKVQKKPVFQVYLYPMHHLNSQKRHFALSQCDMN
jgi:hypothetical protein